MYGRTATAGAFTGVMPISAVALSALLLGEPLTAWHLGGCALILGGIWLSRQDLLVDSNRPSDYLSQNLIILKKACSMNQEDILMRIDDILFKGPVTNLSLIHI